MDPIGHFSPDLGWLVLSRGHAVPIDEIAPDPLKKTVRDTVKARMEQISHLGLLNAVAKELGFRGGWNGFQREAYPELQRFLSERGLRQRVDLVCASNDQWQPYRLSRRDLADRLFESGLPAPERILVARNLDWGALVDDEEEKRQYGPIWLTDAHRCFNLLGDQLVEPDLGRPLVNKSYFTSAVSDAERRKSLAASQRSFDHLRDVMRSSVDPWITVTPFNDRIFILGAVDGTYDLIFRNCRDVPPPAPFDGVLDSRDLPKSIHLDVHLSRWLYQKRGEWDEQETHEAEVDFYAGGGDIKTYPGQEQLRYQRYDRQERYVKVVFSAPSAKGYSPVPLPSGQILRVSPLVTIDQFFVFLKNGGYHERRAKTVWENDLDRGNPDLDHSLPATLTWYDALAYCAWIEKKSDLPVRPPSIEEYRQIRPDLSIVPSTRKRSVPPKFGADEPLSFPESLVREVTLDGVQLVLDVDFGEWLLDHIPSGKMAAAVNTLTMRGAHDGMSLERDFFPSGSWGRYRGIKIGLRLCYFEERKGAHHAG